MPNNDLNKKIEAILFQKGTPTTYQELASSLKVSNDAIIDSCRALGEELKERGVVLIQNGDSVALATNPEYGPLIEKMRKEELERELTKASLETLAIILYKPSVARSEIDYIRGVNSSFILRNLLLRGLIEKEIDPHDARRYMYRPTLDMIRYLGISGSEELAGYSETSTALQTFMNDIPKNPYDDEK